MGIADKFDELWMSVALACAERAFDEQEVPVGALVVLNNQLVGLGWNRCVQRQDPCAHAEIIALRDAAKSMQNYRLPGTVIYSTLEPCAMCAGAMLHARVVRCVSATSDPKSGAAGSVLQVLHHPQLNHKPSYQVGVLADQSSSLLKRFFQQRRSV